jgi:hypothetical protein
MDLYKAIRELYEEKRRLDQVIASLEALQEVDGTSETPAAPKRRGRKSMSPEEKKEVSERMKGYWATRKKSGSNANGESSSGQESEGAERS